MQNGPGAVAAGAGVGGSRRDRTVFSGEDNSALCGASELQNGRRKGPDGKASADKRSENFAATQCLLSLTVLSASDPVSLAAKTWSEKRFRVTSRHATPLAQWSRSAAVRVCLHRNAALTPGGRVKRWAEAWGKQGKPKAPSATRSASGQTNFINALSVCAVSA